MRNMKWQFSTLYVGRRYFGTFHLAQCTHSISVIGARFSEKNNDGAWQQKVGGASRFENT